MALLSKGARMIADAVDSSDHLEVVKLQPPDGLVVADSRSGERYGVSVYDQLSRPEGGG